MTTPMTCALFEDRLMAYLEQETDDATRAAMDRHALSCDDCGTLLADLRKLRFDAGNLPTLAPPRDLWAGIAARIQAPVVPIGNARAAAAVQPRRWVTPALIAASLVLAAGLGWLGATRRMARVPVTATLPSGDTAARVAMLPPSRDTAQPTPAVPVPAPAATAPAPSRASTPVALARNARPTGSQAILAADQQLTRDYNREIAGLRTLIEQRRNQLDPITVAIIEKNVAVIDTAIAQCRAAIARDPASRFLLESLNQSLQTKVELMRTAALLPSRT